MVTNRRSEPYSETDWTDLNGRAVAPYPKSKTIAERAAWDFVAKEGGGLELSVVNPVAVLGPVLGADYSPSIMVIQRLMDGAMPGCPKLYFALVDVRDVADLHIRAMTQSRRQGRALHRRRRRHDVDARHRQSAEARAWAMRRSACRCARSRTGSCASSPCAIRP